jgi:hypothetical protein
MHFAYAGPRTAALALMPPEQFQSEITLEQIILETPFPEQIVLVRCSVMMSACFLGDV